MMDLSHDKEELKTEIYDLAESYDPLCLLEAITEIAIEMFEAMVKIKSEELRIGP